METAVLVRGPASAGAAALGRPHPLRRRRAQRASRVVGLGHSRAASFSNAAYALAAYPLVVDAGLVTWLGRGKADAALQLALIDIEAATVTTILTTTMQRMIYWQRF